jgi:hypothetical protein
MGAGRRFPDRKGSQGAVPSFDLPLLLTGALDPRVAFTSLAGGAYTDSAGNGQVALANQPRFNYSAGILRGMLIASAQTENAIVSNLDTIGGLGSSATVYVECYCPTLGLGTNPGVLTFDDGTASNAITFFINDATTDIPGFVVFVGGVAQANMAVVAAATAGQILRLAATWSDNSFKFAANGVAAADDTSGTIPTVTRMVLGQSRGGGNYLESEMRRVKIWRGITASSAELQALTA